MPEIRDFKWQKRLIIVFTPQEDHQATVKSLDGEQALIDDRHIVWFVVSGETVSSNYPGSPNKEWAALLRNQFQSDHSGATEVVLVGKDGGVKHRSNTLETRDIYYRIDQMPMRQSEMGSDE
jgi:hypothetical protein